MVTWNTVVGGNADIGLISLMLKHVVIIFTAVLWSGNQGCVSIFYLNSTSRHYPMYTQWNLSGGKADLAVSLPLAFVCFKIKNEWSYTPTPLYAFMTFNFLYCESH